ncbi:MAG: PD-(D/E)XK nuclease family protein [Haloechinothrix sp.]
MSLITASPGAAAVAALRDVLDGVRGGDPLAPVDVVVPSATAGVTVRRVVAGEHGLANVRFDSLPQVAERLAARHLALGYDSVRRPLTQVSCSRAVRAAVQAADPRPGSLAASARHRATAGLLEGLFAELDGVRVDPAAAGPALTGRGREVLDLYRAYRERIGGLVSEVDMLRTAAEAVDADKAPATHVVLFAVDRLSEPERSLIAALGRRGRLSAVVCLGGHPPSVTATWLAGLFGMVLPAENTTAPQDVRLTVAPDAEEEVRIVIRSVLASLAERPDRPERIGIGYRTSVPYARLLSEQLTVAGLPHHVPGQRVLAQTVAGRVLSGLLGLHLRGYPRADVINWLSDAPVIDADGRRVPAARWDRVSREAGVSRGLKTWRDRLQRHAAEAQRRAAELPDEDARRAQHTRRAVDARALRTEVEQIAAAADAAIGARTWASVAAALTTVLRRCLGTRRVVDGWNRRTGSSRSLEIGLEQDAYDAVAAFVASLSEWDGLAAPPTPEGIVAAVTDGLDTAVPSSTTLGRGLLVGPIAQFACADLDLLLVVGMTEGSFPPRQREHPALRDADRRILSPDLPTVGSRRGDERRQWDAALRSASRVELSYPRADTRSQRRQFASPWFLEQATRLAGRPVGAGDVDAYLDPALTAAPWLTSIASFDHSLRCASILASEHELDVTVSMRGGVDELASDDHRFQRGLAAARARGSGQFGPWTGHVGPLPTALRADVDGHLSASTLQAWATCPASYLFGQVLGVRELEDRAGEDTIDPRDKGSLVHGVLETLFAGHLGTLGVPGRAPEDPWTVGEIERARQLLDEHAAALEERGLTGREVLWQAQLAHLRRALARVLSVDSALRRQRRAWPVAVEAAFGRHGSPGLVVDLPTQGPVAFAGYIDRIDATESGGLVVLDYKTGRGYGYEAIPTHARPDPAADLVDRGRKLQLLLYTLAARQLQGLPDAEVDAYFWFVEQGDRRRGATIGEEHERRLHDVLDVVVAGIRDGVYPANPGNEDWRTGRQGWDSCGFCPYDRVCPTTRGEQWRQVREDFAVGSYATLAEPEATP